MQTNLEAKDMKKKEKLFCKFCGGRLSEIPKMRENYDEYTGRKEGYIIQGCTTIGCEGRCDWEGHDYGRFWTGGNKCTKCKTCFPDY